MTSMKMLSKKLQLVSATAMLSVSLINVQTAYGYITPGGDSNRVTPVTPRPGTPVRPEPIRPTPRPRPRPTPSYPGPVYPIPSYPGPIYPPSYPSYPPSYPSYPNYPTYPAPVYSQTKTVYMNRWVYGETLYVNNLITNSYSYAGYRVKSVRMDISGNASASVNLIINGQIVDSKYTYGQDVYLYPTYYTSSLSSIAIQVNGSAYIYNVVFELERSY